MATIELDYVNSFYVRGKLKHTFRRGKHKRVTIHGRRGSQEFMDQYHALLAKTDEPASNANVVGASRIKPGTIDALVVKYLQHDYFTKGLAKTTQVIRRQILDNFRQCMTPSGYRYGENRLATIQRKNITDALAGKTPNAQRSWLKALRHLIAFAIEQDECETDPTTGIKITRSPKSSGHMTWDEPQIERYRGRYENGTMARLALELMLNIAARRQDACLIGRQHLRNGCLTWRPSKTSKSTGKVLTIRVLPPLQAALDAMPRTDALTFLLSEYNRPFKSAGAFGAKFGNWCKDAGLVPVLCDDGKMRSYRAHGLRKAACKQLAHAGCTAPEIMAISGHATLSQVQVYIDAVDQEHMAEAAMIKRAAGSKQQPK